MKQRKGEKNPIQREHSNREYSHVIIGHAVMCMYNVYYIDMNVCVCVRVNALSLPVIISTEENRTKAQ